METIMMPSPNFVSSALLSIVATGKLVFYKSIDMILSGTSQLFDSRFIEWPVVGLID